MSQRIIGTVKSFDAAKGYGYIDAGIDEDIFVYYRSIKGSGSQNLLIGDQVEFDMVRKPSGPVALDVTRS